MYLSSTFFIKRFQRFQFFKQNAFLTFLFLGLTFFTFYDCGVHVSPTVVCRSLSILMTLRLDEYGSRLMANKLLGLL